MKNTFIFIIFILLSICATSIFPSASFSDEILIFKESTLNNGTMPHTIVLPDCRNVPYIAIQSTCGYIDNELIALNLTINTCSGYDESIMSHFSDMQETVSNSLEDVSFVLFDTGSRIVTPIDLAVMSRCARWPVPGSGGGNGGGGSHDNCPGDPNKTEPGICGCGVADTDTDGDGVANCNDNCIDTPNPGQSDLDQDGLGDVCDAVDNTCPSVTDLAARTKSGKVQLTWPPIENAQCYHVYRSLVSGGSYAKIAECLVTNYATYMDVDVTNGVTYYYVIRTDCGNGEAESSNEVSVTPTQERRRR